MQHIVPPYLTDVATGGNATKGRHKRATPTRQLKRLRNPSKSPQFLSTIKQLNITD